MASFSQLPSGAWRAQVRRSGMYRAATFPTRREAKDWAAQIETQAKHIQTTGFAPVPKSTTLSDLIDKYQEHISPDSQGKTKAATINMLRRELGKIKLASLSNLHLRDFIDRRQEAGAGGVTIAADLSFLSVILTWGRDVRLLDINAEIAKTARASLKQRKLTTRSQERDREPTDQELARLYSYWAQNLRQRIDMVTICKFALATGMRQGEICRIDAEDVNAEKRTVIVRDRKDPRKKDGNDQIVPLLPEAWAIVEPMIAERPTGRIFDYNEASVSTAFTRACQALEIKDLHFHDLRHRATAQFFRMGLGIPQVALLTGHKTWAMLKRYTKITASDVHAAFEKPASPAPVHAGQKGDGAG